MPSMSMSISIFLMVIREMMTVTTPPPAEAIIVATADLHTGVPSQRDAQMPPTRWTQLQPAESMTPIRLKMPSLAQTQWPDTAWTRVMKNEMKQCDLSLGLSEMLLANEKKKADFIEIGSVVAFWVEEEIANPNEWIRPFCVGTESQTEACYPKIGCFTSKNHVDHIFDHDIDLVLSRDSATLQQTEPTGHGEDREAAGGHPDSIVLSGRV
ncbi:hypothetical protein WR25_25158 [Diploscapter pachys]|uniref:Uncharacterized protein n=1 Tax=Diploscapter pachys TaxID=2018661 RepID=A0A2A2LVX0_9BILA|nr:hypothetical protein WR25_25158 [Diploscapter pachys]